jgi:rSAM/selenodomain-associated transferase 1
MKKALIVFVKAPVPGNVKTRLQPCIPQDKVIEIYKSFVMEILDTCSGIKKVDKYLGCSPIKDDDFLRAMSSAYKMKTFVQRGKGLTERIINAIRDHFKKGYSEIVLIGSDSPSMSIDFIQMAFTELKKNDLVIGPCFDQGLYLIGAKKKRFNDIIKYLRLDTGEDVNSILKMAVSMDIKLSMLPFWYDVDEINDLRFLETHRHYLNKLKS